MSLVNLQVDIPSHQHSFRIRVPSYATISEVKTEIYRNCVGSPRVNGQRLIWRGRELLDDERVQDILTSSDSLVVLLAVHPSAWTSAPPDVPEQHPHIAYSIPPLQPEQHIPAPAPPLPPRTSHQCYILNHTTAYIHSKHESALLALLEGRIISRPGLQNSRAAAIYALESRHYAWPSILDEEYPERTPGGLQYKRCAIEGNWYLVLQPPESKPTPFQLHALKVLTYTFQLLSMLAVWPPVGPVQPVLAPPTLNQVLQQVGLPPIRLPENIHPNLNLNPHFNANLVQLPVPEARENPFRPLIAPLVMLFVRTMLLLYFVAPARKPVIGIVILGWVVYEGWGLIGDRMRRIGGGFMGDQVGQNGPAGRDPVQPVGQIQPILAQPRGQAGLVPQGRANIPDNQAAIILDTLAYMNLDTEEQVVQPPPGVSPPEPRIFHKIWTFFGLLVLTMHPELWNRRRAALRQREGRLRTEANGRESPPPAEEEGAVDERRQQIRSQLIEQHARRPLWVRRYIERVRHGDWVDDDD